MKRLLKHWFVNTCLLNFSKSLKEGFLTIIHFLIADSLDTDGEGGLPRCVVETRSWAEVGRLASFNNRLVKWCVWSFQQDVCQHLDAEWLVRFNSGIQLAKEAQSKFCLFISFRHQVRHKVLFLVDRSISWILKCQLTLDFWVAFEVRLQNFFFYKLQVFRKIQVSIGEESTVWGVVIRFVKIEQFLVGQVGDVLGLTAWIEFVLTFFEKIFVDFVKKCVVWVTHCALHFVVDNALVH